LFARLPDSRFAADDLVEFLRLFDSAYVAGTKNRTLPSEAGSRDVLLDVVQQQLQYHPSHGEGKTAQADVSGLKEAAYTMDLDTLVQKFRRFLSYPKAGTISPRSPGVMAR
jgi:hypothetical protein